MGIILGWTSLDSEKGDTKDIWQNHSMGSFSGARKMIEMINHCYGYSDPLKTGLTSSNFPRHVGYLAKEMRPLVILWPSVNVGVKEL